MSKYTHTFQSFDTKCITHIWNKIHNSQMKSLSSYLRALTNFWYHWVHDLKNFPRWLSMMFYDEGWFNYSHYHWWSWVELLALNFLNFGPQETYLFLPQRNVYKKDSTSFEITNSTSTDPSCRIWRVPSVETGTPSPVSRLPSLMYTTSLLTAWNPLSNRPVL